tara:strand:+ start:353 stop:535 length:183 start_codon:yes stop_codon:yes gene_type:complete
MVIFLLGFTTGIITTIIAFIIYAVYIQKEAYKTQRQLINRISEGFCYDESLGETQKRYES